MTTSEDVTMANDPEDDDVQLAGQQTPQQVAQASRHGPSTPIQVDQFPGGTNRTPSGSDTPGNILGQVTNKQLKTAVTALMTAQGMAISQAFDVHLDHLKQSGNTSYELLDRMVESLGKGVNPSPTESRPRAQSAEEFANEANMITAHAKAEEENNRLAKQVAAAKAEARKGEHRKPLRQQD